MRKVLAHYNLALQMAQFIQNMPARYRATFSQWRNVTSLNTFGNTGSWISGINSGLLPTINTGYQQATTPLLPYGSAQLWRHDPGRAQPRPVPIRLRRTRGRSERQRNGHHRLDPGDSQDIQTQIDNLEQDSFSSDPNLNTEVSVLNKINAANVLTLRTLQDSNKLLVSLLEEQTIIAKQQREATTNTINADIDRRANLAGNMTQVTGTLTSSLQSFQMP